MYVNPYKARGNSTMDIYIYIYIYIVCLCMCAHTNTHTCNGSVLIAHYTRIIFVISRLQVLYSVVQCADDTKVCFLSEFRKISRQTHKGNIV